MNSPRIAHPRPVNPIDLKAHPFMSMASLAPEVRTLLDQSAQGASWHELPLTEARAVFLASAQAHRGTPPELGAVSDLSLTCSNGTLNARLYVPNTATHLRPTLLYFHGGGFVLGSVDSHDALCRHLAAASGVQVLSVDYRLAPEHKFPAALDDALAAARWLLNNYVTLDADPERLAIGGDSAGANLATAVCRLLSPLETPALRHQTLIYPMIDLRLALPSHAMFGEGYRLTAALLHWFVASYLRSSDQASDPRISPLLTSDLRGLPPALVLTAGFDPLRDEGRAYADALSKAGVQTQHVCFEDMIHGFCNMPGSLTRAREAVTLVGKTLATALA